MKALFLLSVLFLGSVPAMAGTVAVNVANVPSLLKAIVPYIEIAAKNFQERALYIESELTGNAQKEEALKLMTEFQVFEKSLKETTELDQKIQMEVTKLESEKPKFAKVFKRAVTKAVKKAGCLDVKDVEVFFDLENGNIIAKAETSNCDAATPLAGEMDESGDVQIVLQSELTCANGSKLVLLTSKKNKFEFTDIITDLFDGGVCLKDASAPAQTVDPRIQKI